MYDKESLDDLILKYDKYIKSIVKRYKVSSFDADDLYQAGCIGLLKAINNFNSTYNVKLTTFAFKYIIGEISKEYTKLNIYGKTQYNRIRNYIDNNKNKTTDELIKDLNVSKEVFFQALTKTDKIIYLTDERLEMIKDYHVNNNIDLNEEEALLWKLYTKDYLNQAQIAKIINVSQASISRKLHKIADKIKNEA